MSSNYNPDEFDKVQSSSFPNYGKEEVEGVFLPDEEYDELKMKAEFLTYLLEHGIRDNDLFKKLAHEYQMSLTESLKDEV